MAGMKASIYLTFPGNCREAFAFYQKVFKVKPTWFMTNGDSPMKDQLPKEEHDKVMHTSVQLTSNLTLMGCDYNATFTKTPLKEGNNCEIALAPETKEAADALYGALTAGKDADVNDGDKPLEMMFWMSYWGCCTDRFGVKWMFDVPQESATAAASRILEEHATQLAASAETLKRTAEKLKEEEKANSNKKAKTDK